MVRSVWLLAALGAGVAACSAAPARDASTPASSSRVASVRPVEPSARSRVGEDDHPPARFAALAPSPLDEVARVAADSASAGFVISASAVHHAMARVLGSGMWPYVLTGWGSDAEIAAQLEAGLAELRASTELVEIGAATARGPAGRVGVIVALAPPRLPLAIERSGDAARIRLAWPRDGAIAVYAIGPTASHRVDVERTGDRFGVAVDCRDPAALEFRDGERVIATVVAACAPEIAAGARLPATDLGPPARTPVEIEMRVWALVNRERVAHGHAALAWDAESHRFARAHAAEMAQFRYIGHHAPDGTSYAARVAGAPFRSSSSRENVGRAWGPGEVHEAFLHSDGHRANLLAEDVDRGAIGVVPDPDERDAFYIAEFFRR
ncbi:MAG TPA: CAP domain-containing protein [Kofleriaceae bacterium]